MELHTFSSLNEDFLPQYAGSMKDADVAIVYFNPEVIKHKKLKSFSPETVAEDFGGKNIEVFTDVKKMEEKLKSLNYENSALLFMSSGTFSGIDVQEFAKELLNK